MLVLKRSATQHHRTPVPLQRWHFTTLSPFLSKPLPSQFLHFCFFFMFGPFSLTMNFSCRKGAVNWCISAYQNQFVDSRQRASLAMTRVAEAIVSVFQRRCGNYRVSFQGCSPVHSICEYALCREPQGVIEGAPQCRDGFSSRRCGPDKRRPLSDP